MGQADLITDMPAIQSERRFRSLARVLIEVPEIKARPITRVERTIVTAYANRGTRALSQTTASPPRSSPGGLCPAGSRPHRLGVHPRLVKSAGPDRGLFDL